MKSSYHQLRLAFCRNLLMRTNLETFKFKNWVAEVDTISRYGNNEYKVKFRLLHVHPLKQEGKWKVLPETQFTVS